MKYLVIGGTGFLGEKLVSYLREINDNVVVLSRGINKSKNIEGVKFIFADRQDICKVNNLLKGEKFDVIIDLCCMNKSDIESFSKWNVEFDRYIMISSIAVYPLEKDLREDYIIDQDKLSDYGKGKKEAEDTLLNSSYKDKVVIIRFPSLVGIGENGSILKLYYDTILNEKSEFVGNMNSSLSLIDLDDSVKFIKYISSIKYKGIINACSDESIKVKEIISISEQLLKKDRIPNEWDFKSRVVEQIMLNDKAKSLGFTFKSVENLVSDYFKILNGYRGI